MRTNKLFEYQSAAGVGSIIIDSSSFNTIMLSPGSGNEDGWSSNFNDQGQIVFWAMINSATTVFISDAVAVPEPAPLALVLLAFGGLLTRPLFCPSRRSGATWQATSRAIRDAHE